jgi:hypothetical protein
VWTGDRLLVWGGLTSDDVTATGGGYDPATNEWASTRIAEGGVGRDGLWSGWFVWVAERLFVGGGANVNSASYDPVSGSWGGGCSGPEVVEGGFYRSATATDDGFVVWGGTVGGEILGGLLCIVTATGTFQATALAPTYQRERHSSVWSGTELLVYGGIPGPVGVSGGERHDFAGDTWSQFAPEPPPGAPYRWGHVAAWIGAEMLVWGGLTSEDGTVASSPVANAGFHFAPATEEWSPMSTDGAPSPRSWTTGVVVAGRLFVWGGASDVGFAALGDGAIYDPSTDEWLSVSTEEAPSPRALHTVVSTGEAVIVWGGADSTEPGGALPNDGAIYYP